MPYYHDIITDQSWQELIQLNKLIPFVLIGGWATYLYTKTLKSKDIDIAIDYPALSALKESYDVQKNDRLHKYEAVKGPVAIDIYLPHYSTLGMPVEQIMKQSRLLDGFSVVDPDLLFALKMITLNDRGRSPKGRKDFLDLLALAQTGICTYEAIVQLLSSSHQNTVVASFRAFLDETTQVPELNITTHQYAKLKKILLNSFG
ncbi:MAG: hypothetical protein AAB457_04280 [Patescibacteria group bacterium]